MNRMSLRIVLRPGSARLRLAIAAIALVIGTTHSQPLRAQFGGKPSGSYGDPYGSYRGPYKQNRQYDPYDDDRGPSPAEDRGDMVPFKRSGVPLLAVVGLDTQHVSIYDSAGRLMQRSPVSTGQNGYETPAGIFSVVQKKADHNSNLYEDGNMPFMQRITWTGIAMHGGVLPGHPASHGCVRLPIEFASRLFDQTDVGMRVIIVPHDITLAEFDHPHLLNKSSGAAVDALQTMRSIASSKDAEAEAAQRKASEARRAATRIADAAAAAAKALTTAEGIRERADTQLKDAEKALDAARTGAKPEAIKRAETAKDKAAGRLAEADKQLQTAKARAQAKTDAVKASEEEAKAAEAASDAAHDAATGIRRKTLPISVFVSRKAQRFYVRQGYVPVFEGPITIQDHEKPLGTYVFTAFGGASGRVRWGLISMYADGNSKVAPEPVAARKGETREATPADVAGAKAALDRIAIPQEAIQRITDVVLPGSSLIVSDEGPSIETGKDTDFVIVMSGEPQGALKVRQG